MAVRKRITVAVLIGFLIVNLFMIQTSVSFAAEPEDNQQDKYEKVIAHGGGAYKGFETTNSVEAVNHSIKTGYKIIELDMELSSDHKIIMLHDWDRTAMHYYGSNFGYKLSENQFMNLTVCGELEVLTFDKLEEILKKNLEIRIVSDTKGDNLELLTIISEKYPELTDRIIPQIYDYNQWSQVKALGFDDIIFTLYAMPDIDADKLSTFINEKGIYAVTMPDYMAEKDLCRQLSAKGIKVYVHPVSSFEDAQRFMKLGAYGVYSGTLLPDEFTGFERDYYLTNTDGTGRVTKLIDDRIDDWKDLCIHGLNIGETSVYSIDNFRQSLKEQELTMLEPGKHKLTLDIYKKKELLGSLEYYIWKDTAGIRILHKKYEYRLDTVKQERDFNSVMTASEVPLEIRDILEQSLIAKKRRIFLLQQRKFGKLHERRGSSSCSDGKLWKAFAAAKRNSLRIRCDLCYHE